MVVAGGWGVSTFAFEILEICLTILLAVTVEDGCKFVPFAIVIGVAETRILVSIEEEVESVW
jgi:hypothetical protein